MTKLEHRALNLTHENVKQKIHATEAKCAELDSIKGYSEAIAEKPATIVQLKASSKSLADDESDRSTKDGVSVEQLEKVFTLESKV